MHLRPHEEAPRMQEKLAKTIAIEIIIIRNIYNSLWNSKLKYLLVINSKIIFLPKNTSDNNISVTFYNIR